MCSIQAIKCFLFPLKKILMLIWSNFIIASLDVSKSKGVAKTVPLILSTCDHKQQQEITCQFLHTSLPTTAHNLTGEVYLQSLLI